ncbi:hypothetical protein WH47_12348 [Habropoda laboriosa]|uniref:Uncharacterized protein n=1 Tax=Habropoda laboriosa TaxID=597456 RepID=A0A0L7R842_9HYME|nr:hypothetical protein WH47_12348 [Habropoda laboriosa]
MICAETTIANVPRASRPIEESSSKAAAVIEAESSPVKETKRGAVALAKRGMSGGWEKENGSHKFPRPGGNKRTIILYAPSRVVHCLSRGDHRGGTKSQTDEEGLTAVRERGFPPHGRTHGERRREAGRKRRLMHIYGYHERHNCEEKDQFGIRRGPPTTTTQETTVEKRFNYQLFKNQQGEREECGVQPENFRGVVVLKYTKARGRRKKKQKKKKKERKVKKQQEQWKKA